MSRPNARGQSQANSPPQDWNFGDDDDGIVPGNVMPQNARMQMQMQMQGSRNTPRGNSAMNANSFQMQNVGTPQQARGVQFGPQPPNASNVQQSRGRRTQVQHPPFQQASNNTNAAAPAPDFRAAAAAAESTWIEEERRRVAEYVRSQNLARAGRTLLATLQYLRVVGQTPDRKQVMMVLRTAIANMQCRVQMEACPWRGAIGLFLLECIVAVAGEPGTATFASWCVQVLGKDHMPTTEAQQSWPARCRIDATRARQCAAGRVNARKSQANSALTCTYADMLPVWHSILQQLMQRGSKEWMDVQEGLSDPVLREIMYDADTQGADAHMDVGSGMFGCLVRGCFKLAGAVLSYVNFAPTRAIMGAAFEAAIGYREQMRSRGKGNVEPPSIVYNDDQSMRAWMALFPDTVDDVLKKRQQMIDNAQRKRNSNARPGVLKRMVPWL